MGAEGGHLAGELTPGPLKYIFIVSAVLAPSPAVMPRGQGWAPPLLSPSLCE